MNNASQNWENTIYLIDILELGVRAIKFLEKLVTLLLIPLPGSLVVWENKQNKIDIFTTLDCKHTPETGQPVQSLAIGLLPQVAGALHLYTHR